jgi:hypothetical protein
MGEVVVAFPKRAALSERAQRTYDLIKSWGHDPAKFRIGPLCLMFRELGFELDEDLETSLLEDIREIQERI